MGRFKDVSKDYAEYRWGYPPNMIQDIVTETPEKSLAIDCGTGTGQVARQLSGFYEKIIGIDMSEGQISHAFKAPQIEYKIGSADDLSFLPDASADLITVGTAFHWFNKDKFVNEARRVLKPGGIMAVFGIRAPALADDPKLFQKFMETHIHPFIPVTTNQGAKEIGVPEGFDKIQLPATYSEDKKISVDALCGWIKTTSAWPALVENGKGDEILESLKNRLRSLAQEDGSISIKSEAYITAFKKSDS